MQQYIYGNIHREGYRYVSTEPEFFADGQHTAVLRHLVNYDVTCPHGELGAGEHQCFWMAVSNLDNPAAPDRLYLQVSGGDPYRSGYYAQGYLSDSGDGYLYDGTLLRLLRTRFESFSRIMETAEAGNLQPVEIGAVPCDEALQAAPMDKELLRSLLLALLQKKKVIIRLPVSGKAAMDLSREYLLAIYERLPYEQRAVNGFVTGISAAKLKDQVALPAVVKLMLMDADADFTGVKTNSYQVVFDLADPNYKVTPMPRENRDGKALAYVPLIDFLAEQTPEELDEFFSFCRSCMRKDVNGNSLSILDYSMYLDFFDIGRGECSDNSIRSWAANVFSNAGSNSKWTPEIRKVLYERIVAALTPERLESYLLSCVDSFSDLATLGVVDEAEQSSLRVKKGSDVTIRDVHAALTLKMTDLLMQYYKDGTEEMLLKSLGTRFLELGCREYPFLREERPTAATAAALEQLVFPAGSGKTTAMVTTLKNLVHEHLGQFREETLQRYRQQWNAQCTAGRERIDRWIADGADAAQLYADLKAHYLFEELIAPGSESGWNNAIGAKLADFCSRSVPRNLEAYLNAFSFVKESCKCFADHGGELTAEHQEVITAAMDGWGYVLAIHRKTEKVMENLDAHLADLEKLSFLLKQYPVDAGQELAAVVQTRLVTVFLAAHPCLTEEAPTAATVEQLQQLSLPEAPTGERYQAEALRGEIYASLRQYRDGVLDRYRNHYAQQHSAGLEQIRLWCAGGYEDMAVLFEALRNHYLFGELMASREDNSWNTALGSRLSALCQQAEPQQLRDYRLLLAWADRSRELVQQQGGDMAEERIAEVEEAKARWNRVLELSERKCGSLAELLTLFGDIASTTMNPGLAASLMAAGAQPLQQKGIAREEIGQNLDRLLDAAGNPEAKALLASLVNGCNSLKRAAGKTPEQLETELSLCAKLENARLKEPGVRVDVWEMTGTAESLCKLLQYLKNYRMEGAGLKFPNRKVRDWAADHLQTNVELMLAMAARFPGYREKLIPALARKSGAVTKEQILKLYVSGCRKSLLCEGAGADTSGSWKRHIETLFPGWVELSEPCRTVIASDGGKWNAFLILQTVLVLLAGLVPGVAMLVTGVCSLPVCLIWAAVLVVILLVCEILSFALGKPVQKRLARWLGLGALPGIILTIVVLVINLI